MLNTVIFSQNKCKMNLTKVHDVTFETEERIITSALSAPNEFLMLLSSGDVIRYNFDEQKTDHLFSVKSSFSYEDNGFDIEAPSTIYTLDSIVVIVNDYKRHGFVHYPEKYHKLHLWRQDYHADISCYPIALYKDENGVPHLIYSEAWNHLQIMNLDSRQVLTAAKSLIEENAEERHIELYKKYEESNKLPWPRPLDYFFGKLDVSPDSKHFLSAGWAWGSCDAYSVFEIKKFIDSNRISYIPIDGWEHSNRAVCWIDHNMIAVAYDPREEGDEGATKSTPQEIHFYDFNTETAEIKKKVSVQGLNILNSTFQYNSEVDAIISISDTQGVAILSLDGAVLFHDEKMSPDSYNADFNLLLVSEGNCLSVHQLGK